MNLDSGTAVIGPPEMGTVFTWPVRIYYEDTDAGGVVYHANYLKFMERARTEFLRRLGYDLDVIESTEGLIFAVRALKIDYRSPARLNDLVEVTVTCETVRSASIVFVQCVYREGKLLCESRVRVASISTKSYRPIAIPEPMRQQLQIWTGQVSDPAVVRTRSEP